MPPSVNNLHVGNGKAKRRTPHYVSWIKEAGWRINEQRAKGAFRALKPDCWYWTDIRLPENHLGDTDNRKKALHDLLVEMPATPDDRWLLGGTYMRSADIASGTCEIAAVSLPGGVKQRSEELELIARRVLFWSLESPERSGRIEGAK